MQVNLGPWITATATSSTNNYVVVKMQPVKKPWEIIGERWLKQRMIEIKIKCAHQAWRPKVSHHEQGKEVALHYWSLGEPTPDGNDDFHREIYRWRHNWLGLTIGDISAYELKQINGWLARLGKDVWLTPADEFFEANEKNKGHGVARACMGVWLRYLDDHNAFIAFLEALPERDSEIIVSPTADPDEVKRFIRKLRGRNHVIHKTRDGETVLSFTSLDDGETVMAKMKLT